jgi:hypothetical protein
MGKTRSAGNVAECKKRAAPGRGRGGSLKVSEIEKNYHKRNAIQDVKDA